MRANRRSFLKTISAGAAATAATMALPSRLPAKPARKPNMIFIMADDLGKEWINCYGGRDIETPHIDKLAATGLKFHNAYSMPKCTPTRATLLTGRYPYSHGWIGHWDVPRWGAGCHFDPKHNTAFARIMKTAGYTTAIAGKWQINDFRVQPNVLREHGFDEWCMWTGFESGNKPSGARYWNAYVQTTDGKRETRTNEFGPDVYTDFLCDFMKRHKDEPMCMYYPMALPHGPLVHTPDDPNVKDKFDKQRAMVSYIDSLVGRLVGTMEELGIRNNTVVIWTTDNGSGGSVGNYIGDRKVPGGKDKYGENGCNCPYVVSCPGIVPEGKETDALTDFTDLLPTFAELGGAKLPKGLKIDGKSLASVITGRDKDGPRDYILAMGAGTMILTKDGVRPRTKFGDRVIRDKRWKIWVQGGGATKLFDLANDPGEANNLIDSRDKQAVAALRTLNGYLAELPKEDGHPQYDPTPAQEWDLKIGEPKVRVKKNAKAKK